MAKHADVTPVIGILSDPKYNKGAVDAVSRVRRPGVNASTDILEFDSITIAPKDLKLPVDQLEKKYLDAFNTLAKQQLAKVNGLFLPGDEYDVPPELYGQQKHDETAINPDPRRTLLVRALLRNSQEYNITPALAICGSLQQYTALMDGELIQHLPDVTDGTIHHSQPNTKLEANAHIMTTPRFSGRVDRIGKPVASTLYRILQSKEERAQDPEGQTPCKTWVNSIHHQAADSQKVMDNVAVISQAPDGVVEALEPIANLPFIALQYHPELIRRMDRNGNRTLTNDDYRRNPNNDGKDYDMENNVLPKDKTYDANQRILEDLVDKSAAHFTKQQCIKTFEQESAKVINKWQKQVSNHSNEGTCIMV